MGGGLGEGVRGSVGVSGWWPGGDDGEVLASPLQSPPEHVLTIRDCDWDSYRENDRERLELHTSSLNLTKQLELCPFL